MLLEGIQEIQIMMIFGMLYFDQSYKLSEIELIEAARQAFERRTNSKATIALIDMGTDAIPEVDAWSFIHHTW